jgi:hypothetical protein
MMGHNAMKDPESMIRHYVRNSNMRQLRRAPSSGRVKRRHMVFWRVLDYLQRRTRITRRGICTGSFSSNSPIPSRIYHTQCRSNLSYTLFHAPSLLLPYLLHGPHALPHFRIQDGEAAANNLSLFKIGGMPTFMTKARRALC